MNSLFSAYQPIAALAVTPQAARRLQPLCQHLGATLWVSESLANLSGVQVYRGSLKEWVEFLWPQQKTLIFALATGAVVRLIAPLLQAKTSDPAVIVVDSLGKFAISLCGGHAGGGDRLAQLIAQQLNAIPVISGAASALELPAIDTLGRPFGWVKGEGDWTGVSAAIAREEPVEVLQDAGSTLWQQHLPKKKPFVFDFASPNVKLKARVWISASSRRLASDPDFPKIQWHPRVLWVGVGCERGTSRQLIETAIHQTCQRYHLAPAAIAGIATLDRKADEIGILQLCESRNWPLKIFSAESLAQVPVPTPSALVAAEVGTPSVAEAAALSALPPALDSAPALTLSHPLIVPKQIFRDPSQPGAVTVAIAQSPLEYTGRSGQILLIGTGPGELAQMTPAAQTAATNADAVIGYSLYLDLLRPLFRPGQLIEAFPITQEKQRAQRAIALAQWGLTVAVVSSGDCGIYGMAGLVLETLQASDWDGKTPYVQVFPGISALQAAAAKVGAPLMHDFCAISLSDLLTPWPVIEKRLLAAAAADFVTILYNPRSQTRTQQIAIAQSIFLQHRAPATPVALARSVYRQDEQICLTTLEKFLEHPIDMLTAVLIGNSNTRRFADWLITPRGYT